MYIYSVSKVLHDMHLNRLCGTRHHVTRQMLDISNNTESQADKQGVQQVQTNHPLKLNLHVLTLVSSLSRLKS